MGLVQRPPGRRQRRRRRHLRPGHISPSEKAAQGQSGFFLMQFLRFTDFLSKRGLVNLISPQRSNFLKRQPRDPSDGFITQHP